MAAETPETHAAQPHGRATAARGADGRGVDGCGADAPDAPDAPSRPDIPFRENAYPIVEALFAELRGQGVGAFIHAARCACTRPDDVLEYAMWRRSTMGDRQHFPTALRRRLVGLLESFDARSLAEDLALDRERSLRALELLSYSRFSRSPEHMRAVDALRDGTLRSWASAKEQAYRHARATGDHAPLLGLLARRPDVLLREVGRLLDAGVSAGDILDTFEAADPVPLAMLLAALARVDSDEAIERRRRHEEDRLVRRQATALMRTATSVRRARGGLRPPAHGTSTGSGWGASPSVLANGERDLVERLVSARTRVYWAEQCLAASPNDPARRELDEANAEVDALTHDNAPALDAIRARVRTARAAAERTAASVEALVDELLAPRGTAPDDLRPETRELVARARAALHGTRTSCSPEEPSPDDMARHDRWALMGLAYGCATCDLDDALCAFATLAQECVVVDGVDPRLPPHMWELSRTGYVVGRLKERAAEQVGQRIARLAKTRSEAARILRELLARELAGLAAQGAPLVETHGEADVVLTVGREHGEDAGRGMRETPLNDEGRFVP